MQLGERNEVRLLHLFQLLTMTSLLVTDKGKLIRCPVNDIRIAGRQTQGGTLMYLMKKKLSLFAKLEENEYNSSGSIITEFIQELFDPITFGHLDIIIRATHIVNKLIVSVAENTHKKPFFAIEERINMIKHSLNDN